MDRRFVQPQDRNAVLQRISLYTYDVFSQEYSYKRNYFRLNRIATGNGVKYVAWRMPISKLKLVFGGAVALLVLSAAAILGMAKLGVLFILVVSFLAAVGIVDPSFLA